MKRKRSALIAMSMLVPALCGLAAVAPPAGAAAAPLVSTEWLGENLSAAGQVILDVRTSANYGFAHIPGAVSVPFNKLEPYLESKGCQLMPPPETVTEILQGAGVSSSTHVIVYDHGNTTSDATKGAAALWILHSMGHENVSYLNGGFTKWTFEGRKIDNKVPSPARGDFTAALNSSKVATLEEIVENLKTKEALLVDDRNAAQYFGISKRGDAKRYGHIPGSICLPADYLTNAGINRAPATVKSTEELTGIVKGAGVPADKSRIIIVYCNSAQQAGLAYLVLGEILEYRNVKVFDGSMLEYATREDLPVVRYAW